MNIKPETGKFQQGRFNREVNFQFSIFNFHFPVLKSLLIIGTFILAAATVWGNFNGLSRWAKATWGSWSEWEGRRYCGNGAYVDEARELAGLVPGAPGRLV